MRYLTEDLIEELRDITKAPPNVSDASILRALNRQMTLKMVPMIKSVRQNFFLTYLRSSLVADQFRYVIPGRTIGNSLEAIWLVDSTGARQQPIHRGSLAAIDTSTAKGDPREVLFVGDEVMTFPTPAVSQGYLEFWAEIRPNQIVKTEECAKITAVNSAAGTTTFTVDTDLTATLSVGSKVDIVSGESPFMLWCRDAVITAIDASSIAVATSSVSNEVDAVEPVAGDYIAAAKTTNIPTIPEELHPLLCHMAAVPVLQAIGDLNKLNSVRDTLAELQADSLKLIEDRLKSQPEVIVNQALSSAMGDSAFSGFGF